MTLRERVRNWLQVPTAVPALPPAAPAAPKRHAGSRPAAHMGGKRLRISQDDPTQWLSSGLTLLAPLDPENRWRGMSLDDLTLDKISSPELLELLSDLSPEISLALWNLLRLGNPGWEVKALRPGSDTIEPRAQAAIDAFLAQLSIRHGSVDVVINRLFVGAFLRGAFFAELVLDNAGRLPLDLAVPDARYVYFRNRFAPQVGPVWEPYQLQHGDIVSLDRPTIRYVPVDPFPARPYGRPIAQPALFTALFTLGLLHDLRRVIAQQGYPRLDLTVALEQLKLAMPDDIQGDPDAREQWVSDVIKSIQDMYASLKPEDAYVHTDVIDVGRPVGTADSNSLGAIGPLVEMLERQATRALKSSPLLMALSGSSSESQANRQWEVGAAGIKSLQHLAEGLLEYLLTIALQAQGLQADVEFRFAELRAAELLRDAQVASLNAQNAYFAYQAGWVGQDEAAMAGAGKEKADQPEPRAVPSTFSLTGSKVQEPSQVQAEPGGNRGVPLDDRELTTNGNGRT